MLTAWNEFASAPSSSFSKKSFRDWHFITFKCLVKSPSGFCFIELCLITKSTILLAVGLFGFSHHDSAWVSCMFLGISPCSCSLPDMII